MHVVIVGASVAGIRTVQALRAQGYGGRITVLGDELYPPYDKPPLSKEMLDPDADGSPVELVDAQTLEALSVDLRLGVRATAWTPTPRSCPPTRSARSRTTRWSSRPA